jgi:hypothetical protein
LQHAVPRQSRNLAGPILTPPPSQTLNRSTLSPSTTHPPLTPSQTRITTKYTLLKPSKSAPRKEKPSSKPADDAPAALAPEPIRATLTLKTYDPISGTTLKYSTTKAAEVSRLIQILGRLGRPMAGLPEVREDLAMVDTPAEGPSGVATPVVEVPGTAGKPGQGGGGAKKGKKKGKK